MSLPQLTPDELIEALRELAEISAIDAPGVPADQVIEAEAADLIEEWRIGLERIADKQGDAVQIATGLLARGGAPRTEIEKLRALLLPRSV